MTDLSRTGIDWSEVKERVIRAGRVLEERFDASPERQQQVLRARARAVTQRPAPDAPATGQQEVFCFRIGEIRCGLSPGELVSASRLREAWRLPGMPGAVPGVIQYHGDLIAVIDLRRLLHIESGDPGMIVMASAGANMVAMLADEVEGTRMLPAQSYDAVPAHLGDAYRRFVRAVMPDTILLLDLPEICQFVRMLDLH